MRASLKPRSIYDIFALIGCVAAVGGGTAYAANTIGSGDIIDESIQSVDIKNGEVKGADIGSNAITSNRIYPKSVTTSDIADDAVGTAQVGAGALFGSDIFDGSLTSADLGTSSVGTSEIANGSVTGDDIAAHTIGQGDIDGTDHYGALGVGGVSSGRCTTVTVSTGGSQAGDAGILTTDGTIPDGQVFYLQRVLDDNAQVKVCNLSGGDLPAITVNVRILTFH
jgi:hypothetical protein